MIGGLLVLSAAPAWAISNSPTSLDFGKIRAGSNSAPSDVTLTISAGYRYTGSFPSGSTGVSFGISWSGTCTGFVGPGTCVLHVSFLTASAPGGVGVSSTTFVSSEVPTGGGAASTSNLSITGEGVLNAAPVCQNVSTSTVKNRAADLDLSCTDADPITYAVVTPPQHGSLTLTPGTGAVNYVPDFGYTGPDSFTYQADDGIYPASNVSTANITVQPRDDQPSPTPVERFSLNLSKVGKGKIVSDPVGINCGNDCTEDFAEGSEVTLTAKARAGWEFKRWRYRCKGQGKVCTIEVSSNFRAMAVFVRPPIVGGDRNRS